MKTAVFRVQRVLTAAGSPVARIEAADSDGHELRLEVPTQTLEDAAPGRLLVLQWSMHNAPSAVSEVPVAAVAAPSNPAAVDQEFMTLFTRGRSPATPTAQIRGIDEELSSILGVAEAKGQK